MTSFNLRPYQTEAIDTIMADFRLGHYKVGCILPTGAGKTEIMLCLADKYMDEFGGKTLILSHMGLLVGQTSDRAEIRIPHRRIGWLMAGHTPTNDDDIVVGTMQSARIEDKLRHIKDVGLVIVDEAHYITAQSYQDIMARHSGARVLGFTATPFKAKRLMTNKFEKVSYCAALQDMIDQGYLLPPKLIAVEQADSDITSQVVSLYREKEEGRKTLVFMPTVEEAELMHKVFTMEGYKSAVIVGTTPVTRRQHFINQFQTGDLNILITVDVLTAGFDAPCVESIIMPVRCGSPTIFMQRVGRGLRKYGDKSECRVYFFGKVPKLEKKFYEEMVKFSFNAKKEKMDLFEQLEWAKFEDDPDAMVYCEKMLKIHNESKKLGYEWFSQMVAEEKLGPELLGRIDEFHNKLKGVRVKESDEPCSIRQKRYLESLMGVEITHDLKVEEARNLVGAMIGMTDKLHPVYGEQWTLKSGQHKGKHIKDVPFMYVQWCMAKQPDSSVCRLFHKWTQFKKEFKR